MLTPGTHLVKNHEPQSRVKNKSLKLMLLKLGPSLNQTVNLKTDSRTL